MKVYKKIMLALLGISLIILASINIWIEKNGNTISTISEKTDTKIPNKNKVFQYSDIISLIFETSHNFRVTQIDSNVANNDFISIKLEYKGSLDELISSISEFKKRGVIKIITEINLYKEVKDEYSAKLNVDFFKYK